MRYSIPSGTYKFAIGWIAVFAFRFLLLPFRVPNMEPMLATVMPFSKRYSLWASFAFGFFGIALYDAVTSGIGIWTLVTALAYGAIGIAAHAYFKKREASRMNFVVFGVSSTILYDIATGLTIGPLYFNQPFMGALIGQIPFTLMHLAGTVLFALFLSPLIYRWVVTNESLEVSAARVGAHA